MKKVSPKYSKSQIDKAGETISRAPKNTEALKMVNDWREQHISPMDTVFSDMKALSHKKNIIVAERLKRLPTIIHKLKRYPTMRLSKMQDVAGVRAIMPDASDIPAFVKSISNPKGDYLLSKPPTNYILQPKEDGYRGVHLIYEFPDSKLFVELQVRSRLQHSWATAIESMSIYLDQPFKSSGGDKKWHEFFALVASAFAYFENTTPISRHKKIGLAGIYKEIRRLDDELKAIDKIKAFAAFGQRFKALATLGQRLDLLIRQLIGPFSQRKPDYVLLSLDLTAKKTRVKFVSKNESEKAMREYEKMEKRGNRYDQVLVSISKMSELDEAYPNYFLDLQEFVDNLEDMTSIYGKYVV